MRNPAMGASRSKLPAAAVLRRVTEAHGPDSPLVAGLVDVFRAARERHLRFTLDLHGADEDRHFFCQVVFPKNEVWVAHAGGEPVAFIAFARGWVNHLYVAPVHQGKGLGRRLLDLAKAASPSLQLWAFEANAPAIRFYEREGFRVVERTDGAGNEARMADVRMEWAAPADPKLDRPHGRDTGATPASR